MDKRKTTLMGGSVLVLALVTALGIVYAAYSQSLTINGTASVKANSWDVHFTNLQPVKITGDAQEITAPTIKNNSTAIGDYSVLLSKPGDSIEYSFDIENMGTFNAVLGENGYGSTFAVNVNTPECIGIGDNAENDSKNVCSHLVYYLTFENYYEKNTYYGWGYGGIAEYENKPDKVHLIWPLPFFEDIVLKPNEKISEKNGRAKLILEYCNDVEPDELPKNDVAISNLGVSINFSQAK